MDFEFSTHALDMLKEREIPERWVRDAIDNPDWTSDGIDGNAHHYKSVPERGGRFLHVVINARVLPAKVVTIFFDRRARRP
jgi:Domain of unknown function (DUF4258)